MTDTDAGAGHYFITRHTASLSDLNFGAPSTGTAFIDDRTGGNGTINDATSTKQTTTALSGIIVQAAAITPNRWYLHGCAGSVCPLVPVAAFSGTPLTGEGPLPVQFTDASTGTPAKWAWTFGDGAISPLQNPSHTFNPGSWTVSLTVTNALGTNTITKTSYVDVSVPAGATYTALPAPLRMLDTRFGTGLSGKFASSAPRTFAIAGVSGIPANAVAITGNLTVTGQSKAGYVTLGPTVTATPTSSTLNFPAGDTRANAVTVALDGVNLSAVYKSTAGATTNLILDVTGYFVRDTAGDTYKEFPPARVLDTRLGTGLSGKFVNSSPRSFQVRGVGGVPSGAVAVTGNLTVTGQTNAGYVTLGPTVSSTPSFSTLNFPKGDVRANAVTVGLDGSGQLAAVYKGSGTTDLLFDVTGYFLHDLTGARYIALEPVRLLDTRVANGLTGPFGASAVRNFMVGNRGGVPTAAVAITGNLTVVNQTKAGYVTLGPTVTSTPSFSTINFPAGDVRANAVTVGLNGSPGTLGAVYKAPTGATTNLILNVTGYFK